MGKHSKPPTTEKVDKYLEQLEKNPKSMARFLLLINAVDIIDKKEKQLGIIEEDWNDGNGAAINNYIDDNQEEVTDILIENKKESQSKNGL